MEPLVQDRRAVLTKLAGLVSAAVLGWLLMSVVPFDAVGGWGLLGWLAAAFLLGFAFGLVAPGYWVRLGLAAVSIVTIDTIISTIRMGSTLWPVAFFFIGVWYGLNWIGGALGEHARVSRSQPKRKGYRGEGRV
jgi:hypothetical protein